MIHQSLYRSRLVGPNLIRPNRKVLSKHKPILNDLPEPKSVGKHVRTLGLPIEEGPLLFRCQEDGGDGGEEHAPIRELVVECSWARRRRFFLDLGAVDLGD